MGHVLRFACLAGLWAFATVGAAGASTIIDRNTSAVTLQVNRSGEALVSYRLKAKRMSVLAWGAVNASAPTRDRPQVAFKRDYTGGYQTHYVANPAVAANLAKLRALQKELGRQTVLGDNKARYALAPKIAAVYKTLSGLRSASTSFHDACRPYTGPALPWFVTGCTAPDGSYWALQSWQRALPNLGETPWLPEQSVYELHLSHWTGPLPELEIHLDWVNTQKAQHLFGRFMYVGQPVHGFGSQANGNPTDTYGRNVYLDVLDAPAYGLGWKRENSFLTHNPSGNFCYGLYAHAPYPGYPEGLRPAGIGKSYRATVIGPGVLPDVGWQADSIGTYDPANAQQVDYEHSMNALSDTFSSVDKLCHQH
jgi:hypothetical protein